ncbi:MAG: pyridoxamine 5'-phosphate oxidase family protein [Acidimicrobiales bacterium]
MSDALARVQDRTFATITAATAGSYPPERRLSGDQLAAYLDRRAFAVVCSTRPDGRSHATVSSFIRRNGELWLPMVSGSARERNINAKPWVTVVVTEGDHGGHIAVIIEGLAEIVAPAQVPAEVISRVPGEWVKSWTLLRPERLLSYAAEGALLAGE